MPLCDWLTTQVSLKFSSVQQLPAEQTTLTLKANPKSLCSVRAIDQSVLLLKPEQEITVDFVWQQASHQSDEADTLWSPLENETHQGSALGSCPNRCLTSCRSRSCQGTTTRWKTSIRSAVSPAWSPGRFLISSLFLKLKSLRHQSSTSTFDQSARSSSLRSIRR